MGTGNYYGKYFDISYLLRFSALTRRHLSYVPGNREEISAISPTSLIVASGNGEEGRKEGGSEGGLSGFEPREEGSWEERKRGGEL